METAETIADLYRENTQGAEPSDEQVQQLLAALEPGEQALFTCGWPDMSEKWGPLAQLTVTTRRILDQRWAGPGGNAPVHDVELRDVVAVTDRQRGGERNIFETRALVVTLKNGTTLIWEHLTNHQVTPAAEAIERAREEQ